uniref:t-SNARE coiled-coil homology domain-containing protein n=1 Tax=Corethron hystrix TaxID=216773 RepID=A0A7S1B301_9STRA|mmetsp:Transcript_10829/g.23799  ORF Transcript_10829/g.23799 Transcript_10829/m.23799 type:complete len:131 (+) Transcript_10829:271-663(+)
MFGTTAPGGGGYRGLSSRTPPSSSVGSGNDVADLDRAVLERQNDARVDELSSHIASLRALTADIESEARSQNAALDGMADAFGTAGGMLGASSRRIAEMYASTAASTRRTVAYIVVAVLFLSWVMKRGKH